MHYNNKKYYVMICEGGVEWLFGKDKYRNTQKKRKRKR